MLNIKTLAVSETADLHLRSANDELLYDEKGNKVTITLYSPGSKAYAKAQAEEANRMMDLLKKQGKADQTPEEKAAQRAEFLAACTVSFNNFEYEGVKGQEAFKAAYADRTIGFIADQVGKFIGEWGNFIGGSAKN